MTGSPPGLSRREAIRMGIAAGVGLTAGKFSLAAQLDQAMLQLQSPPITRAIPSTRERLSVVGISTARFSATTPRQTTPLCDALRKFSELGGSVVETARTYGVSETVVGGCVKKIGNRSKLFVATRYGLPATRGRARTGRGRSSAPPGPLANLEQSFTRLQMDTIDLLMVHDLMGAETLLPLLRELKQEGRIRYLGASASNQEQYDPLIGLMEKERLDFIEVDFSIGYRLAAQQVLPLAADNGVAVLVRSPLEARGVSLLGRVAGRKVPEFAAQIEAKTWSQLLLKWVIAHPAITAVLPPATRVAQVVDYDAAGRGRLPDDSMRQIIESYFIRS
jgi:aryl-alcohol dehydrogenase-like predicted oxidoreductase